MIIFDRSFALLVMIVHNKPFQDMFDILYHNVAQNIKPDTNQPSWSELAILGHT